jgi:citrate synthase
MIITLSMNNNSIGKREFWERHRGVIRTSKGGWRLGECVTSHGYSLLENLIDDASFFQVMVLNAIGRLPEARLAKWLEATFICMSWPDPRIWCNHIGSLGGTTKSSPVAAVCAGILASDSRMYGPGTALAATEFITEALEKKNAGYPLDKILEGKNFKPGKKVNIPGFARPIAKGDERVIAMQRVSGTLGFRDGPHLTLAYEIQDFLFEHCGEGLNLAGYMVAFLSDQGLQAKEIYRINSLCVNGGIHACYAEAADRPPESFLPLRCDDIEYTGKEEREIPALRR